jgi:hypothetical protein
MLCKGLAGGPRKTDGICLFPNSANAESGGACATTE